MPYINQNHSDFDFWPLKIEVGNVIFKQANGSFHKLGYIYTLVLSVHNRDIQAGEFACSLTIAHIG